MIIVSSYFVQLWYYPIKRRNNCLIIKFSVSEATVNSFCFLSLKTNRNISSVCFYKAKSFAFIKLFRSSTVPQFCSLYNTQTLNFSSYLKKNKTWLPFNKQIISGLRALWSWMSNTISLCLSFIMCKMKREIMMSFS